MHDTLSCLEPHIALWIHVWNRRLWLTEELRQNEHEQRSIMWYSVITNIVSVMKVGGGVVAGV